MGQPITWQTVRAGSDVADALRPLETARGTFNDAFGAFQNIIKQREGVDQSNMQAGQEMGKQAFLDKLASAKSPEELAALQKAGALDTSDLGVQARAALRGASEARLTGLRQGVTAENTYNDALTARTEAPVAAAIKAKILAGDFAGAQTDLNGAPIRDKSGLQQLIHDTGRQRIGEANADFKTPYEQRQTVRADAAGARTEAEQVYQTGETAQIRNFDNRIAAASAARQSEIEPLRAKTEALVTKFGLPTNTDGTVALDRLTKEQEVRVNNELILSGEQGVPLDKLRGDTAAAQNLRESFRREGARPDQLAKVDGSIAAAFNTTPVAPIGADAAKIERNARIQQATAQMDAGQFVPMTTPGAVGESKDVALQTLSTIHPVGSYRNQNWREAISNFKGIEATDEKGKPILGADGKTPIRVMPGPQAWKDILNGIDNSFFGFGNNDINNALKKWSEDPVNRIGAGRTVTNSLVNGLRNVDIEKPAPSPGITLPTKK